MFSSDEVQGIVRHVITVLAGSLVTHGYIASAQAETLAGAIATILAVAWSVYSKRKEQSVR